MTTLAIEGGTPIRTRPFPTYNTIGAEEKQAVLAVLDSGVLSQFVGVWGPDFFGGPEVQGLEQEWATYFGTRYAVSVNSATSGLYAAVGAAGVGPGDEVIVSPYTMSASATAALVYGGVPVFADIDPETFCLDPASVEARITPRTRAIIAVDLFGHPAEWSTLRRLAERHNLILIEDAAQAPGARYHGSWAGTLGHMGVFSLNYHKTIHSGEGGVVVTNDDALAERLQLIRNHGEVVVRAKGVTNLVNMVGFNYRMTEIEAAIARQQLKKLESLVVPRVEAAAYLTERLSQLPGITPPVVRDRVRHGFYVYALRFDAEEAGMARDRFARALKAEGIPINVGYVEPLYRQPLYRRRIALGSAGFPFRGTEAGAAVSYEDGICPVTERMHEQELLYLTVCHAQVTRADLDDVVAGFEKVLVHARRLVTV